ncbi:ribosome-recycling factor [Patescibacteria group bacterium]
MQSFIDDLKKEYNTVVERLKEDLFTLRTGRATPALVENIIVEVYEQKMPLKSLASLSTPDAKTILIQPWDKAVYEEIIRALENSLDSMHPIVQEEKIILQIPTLTEERRLEFIKILGKKAEDARIILRRKRDEVRGHIQEQERKKEISEDEKFRLQKKIQELIEEYTKILDELEDKKIKEIKE